MQKNVENIKEAGVIAEMGEPNQGDKRQNAMRAKTLLESDHAVSNLAFIRQHARPGALILIGGSRGIENMLRYRQSPLSEGAKSLWSHICVFEGQRDDKKDWIVESDLDFRGMKLINGYTESNTDRFERRDWYPNIAIMDFGLSALQVRRLMSEIKLISQKPPRYPILKILYAILLNERDRIFANSDTNKSLTCSAFVRHLYLQLGIDLSPQVSSVSATFPEDIFRTATTHQRYLLLREDRRSSSEVLQIADRKAS